MNTSYSEIETSPRSTSILDCIGMQRYTPTSDAQSITRALQRECDHRSKTSRVLAHNGDEQTFVWDHKTLAGKAITNYNPVLYKDERYIIFKTIMFAFKMVGYTDEVLDDSELREEIMSMAENTIIWHRGLFMSPKSVKIALYGKQEKMREHIRDRHSARAKQVFKTNRR